MKARAVYVCLLWLGFTIWTFRKTPSENQSAGMRLMLDPSGLECWDQLVILGPLALLTFRHYVAWPQHLLNPVHLENHEDKRQSGTLIPLNLIVTTLPPLLHQVPPHSLKKLGHIPCAALWGMAKPHVCSRLGREIKACQEKPGHCGGVGTGRDGMNKRRVQTKSGLLGLSTISCRVVGASW